MAAPLLAVALCLSAAAPASAAGDRNETAVSAGQSDALRVVSTAQSELDTDPDRRLVDRESSERVDAVVIALWAIAVGDDGAAGESSESVDTLSPRMNLRSRLVCRI